MSIKDNRKDIGFTQQEMAGYLGLHRVQLAMLEKGLRDIPYKAVPQWSKLTDSLESDAELEPIEAALRDKDQQPVADLLQLFTLKQSHSVLKYRKRLVEMKQQYDQAIKTLALVTLLRQKELEPIEQRTMWLNMLESRAMQRSRQCQPTEQVLLWLKLRALELMEQEAALYNNNIS